MPTTVNKDIGGGANDYSTPDLWEADTDNNLVSADEVQVGRLYGSHTVTSLVIAGATTDATRFRRLEAASGQGLGSGDPGRYDSAQGAAISSTASYNIAAVLVQENNFVLRGIQVSTTNNTNQPYTTENGTRAERCLFEGGSTARAVVNSTVVAGAVFEACAIINRGSGSTAGTVTLYLGGTLQNCTIATPSNLTDPADAITINYQNSSAIIRNCVVVGFTNVGSIGTPATCTNNYSDDASLPSGFTTIAYTTSTGAGNAGFENITDGTHDFRIKSGSALDGAGTATGAPANDLSGAAFDSTPSVGAWEFVATSGPAATAFQPNVFQSNAFQIYGGVISAPSGAISGTTSFAFTPTGTIAGAGALAGATTATFTPAGTITGATSLAGSVSFAFTTAGAITGSGALAGSSALTFTTAGAVTGAGALAGTSTPAFTTAGALTGAGALAGTTSPAFTLSGTLTSLAGDIAGTSALAFSLSAALTGSGALAATTTATFTPSATLTGAGALAGTTSATFTTAGALTGSGALAAATTATFSLSGTVAGAGDLASAAALAFTTSGTLTGSGALAGASAPAFTTAGNLTGIAPGDIFGTSAMSFAASGTLTGAGELAGSSVMVFGTSLVFVEPETPQQIVNRPGGGPRRRNYIVNGRRYYNLTNEELAYLLGRIQSEQQAQVLREQVQVVFPSKKPHKISGNAWKDVQAAIDSLNRPPFEEWDDEEEAAMLLL